MRNLLLTIVLVLVMAIPAFAQNGPVKIKPLMVCTRAEEGQYKPVFGFGEIIHLMAYFEAKGTGNFKERIEVRNSAGVLFYKLKSPQALLLDSPTFQRWSADTPLEVGLGAGYYTCKFFYIDVATGNTWSHQTKIHVLPPPQ